MKRHILRQCKLAGQRPHRQGCCDNRVPLAVTYRNLPLGKGFSRNSDLSWGAELEEIDG